MVQAASGRRCADPSGKRQRGALVGNLWTDPLGRLWLFFDQTVIGVPGPTANWFIRCDAPDADTPVWSEPVLSPRAAR